MDMYGLSVFKVYFYVCGGIIFVMLFFYSASLYSIVYSNGARSDYVLVVFVLKYISNNSVKA